MSFRYSLLFNKLIYSTKYFFTCIQSYNSLTFISPPPLISFDHHTPTHPSLIFHTHFMHPTFPTHNFTIHFISLHYTSQFHMAFHPFLSNMVSFPSSLSQGGRRPNHLEALNPSFGFLSLTSSTTHLCHSPSLITLPLL